MDTIGILNPGNIQITRIFPVETYGLSLNNSSSKTYDSTKQGNEVVDLVIRGFRNRKLAKMLSVKEKSVKNYL